MLGNKCFFILRFFITALFVAVFSGLAYADGELKPSDCSAQVTGDGDFSQTMCRGAFATKAGDRPCAICRSDEFSWDNPVVEVLYKKGKNQDRIYRATIGPTQMVDCGSIFSINENFASDCQFERSNCARLGIGDKDDFGRRFCVRYTRAGTEADGDKWLNYNGNKTGGDSALDPNGGPRTQICAFEDPRDAQDDKRNGPSPFHKDEGNNLVSTNVGCVDLPVAEGPPVFRNSAWHTRYYPKPYIAPGHEVFENNQNGPKLTSTFDKPQVRLYFCKDSAGDFINCPLDESGKYTPKGELGINFEQLTLSPEKEDFADSQEATFLKGASSKVTGQNERVIYTAQISQSRSREVCVYRHFDKVEGKGRIQGCVPRPGHMPVPSIVRNDSAGSNDAFLTVTVGDDSDTLLVDECKYINQVEMCAFRNSGNENLICIDGFTNAPFVLADATKSVFPADETGLNQIIPAGEPIPNSDILPNYPTDDGVPKPVEVIFKDIVTGEDKEVAIFNPPSCIQLESNGSCSNYCVRGDSGLCDPNDSQWPDGGVCCSDVDDSAEDKCANRDKGPYDTFTEANQAYAGGGCYQYVKNVVGDDPYKVDPEVHVVRPLSSEEMGFCAFPPADKSWTEFAEPGDYDYTTPVNCGKVEVEVWGGGAGGRAEVWRKGNNNRVGSGNGDKNKSSGGAGGFAKAHFDVVPEDGVKIKVGQGGTVRGETHKGDNHFYIGNSGGSSFVSYDDVVLVQAYGGKNHSEGRVGGSTSISGALAILRMNGGDGRKPSKYKQVAGGSAWDAESASYVSAGTYHCDGSTPRLWHPSMPAVGGCSSWRADPPKARESWTGTGHAGYGGNGKVRIRCIANAN